MSLIFKDYKLNKITNLFNRIIFFFVNIMIFIVFFILNDNDMKFFNFEMKQI
jgi:hypothetical protein